jgi:hypothetical protein
VCHLHTPVTCKGHRYDSSPIFCRFGSSQFSTVAVVLWIWPPLSRPIEIRWLRSNECYSTVNLLQYSEEYFLKKVLQCTAFWWISVVRSRMDALDCLLQCPLCSYEGNYRGSRSIFCVAEWLRMTIFHYLIHLRVQLSTFTLITATCSVMDEGELEGARPQLS